jgi:hypothetical protein
MSDRQQQLAGEQDDLDVMLDRALSSYTPAHPRLGLEDRVRARLDSAAGSAHGAKRIPMLWVWAAVTALAVVLLVAITLRPHARPAPANLAAAPSRPSIPLIPTIQIPDRHPAIALANPPAKLPVNRTRPLRLTPRQPSQEELIAQLLVNGPKAIASLAQDDDKLEKPINIQPLQDDPLVIDPIKIAPIDNSTAETGGKF